MSPNCEQNVSLEVAPSAGSGCHQAAHEWGSLTSGHWPARLRQYWSVPEAFDPGKVDLVSVSPEGTTVNLYIVQSDAWSGSDEQLQTLQQKIHNYVSFALDGPMVEHYPETAELSWRIVIDSQLGPPDSRTSSVLDQVAGAVRRYGGELVV